jgi:hypothetical protein
MQFYGTQIPQVWNAWAGEFQAHFGRRQTCANPVIQSVFSSWCASDQLVFATSVSRASVAKRRSVVALTHEYGIGWRGGTQRRLACQGQNAVYRCDWRFRSANVWRKGYVRASGKRARVVETRHWR